MGDPFGVLTLTPHGQDRLERPGKPAPRQPSSAVAESHQPASLEKADTEFQGPVLLYFPSSLVGRGSLEPKPVAGLSVFLCVFTRGFVSSKKKKKKKKYRLLGPSRQRCAFLMEKPQNP